MESLSADSDRRLTSQEILDRFQTVRHHLTLKQWHVVVLKYGKGLKNVEISNKLGVHQSAVSRLLSRARRTLEDCEAQRRKEEFDLLTARYGKFRHKT